MACDFFSGEQAISRGFGLALNISNLVKSQIFQFQETLIPLGTHHQLNLLLCAGQESEKQKVLAAQTLALQPELRSVCGDSSRSILEILF